jgi:hypothetical protein
MTKVTFFRDADAPMVESQGQGASRVRHPGSSDELQLLEVRVNPNEHVEVHAHKEAEVMYVLSGSMSFGSQQLRPGDSVSITGLTLYTFTAGPEGVRFINFRPREDNTFYTSEQLAEYQKLDAAGKTAMERRLTEAFLERLNWANASGRPVGVD